MEETSIYYQPTYKSAYWPMILFVTHQPKPKCLPVHNRFAGKTTTPPPSFCIITLAYCLLILWYAIGSATIAAGPKAQETAVYVFNANYSVTKDGLPIASSKRSLTRVDTSTFEFTSETKSVGVAKFFSDAHIYELSRWNMDNGRIRPQKYLYKNQSSQKKRLVELVFDWDKNIITNIINGSPWTMAIAPDVKDKLSYQIQITLDLNNQSIPKELSYKVADGGKIKTYRLQVHGIEVLEINGRQYNAIKLSRKNKDRITTFWCAVKLMHLPVKITQQLKDGSVITATMEELLSFKPVQLLPHKTTAPVKLQQ